ncbi:MAG: ATP-binding cassette domain-containing protein [Polyangiaceae bacterium]
MSLGALPIAAVAAVELERVSVRRGALSVLEAVDLRLEPGDSWVIFGENGAGKSTLIQLVSGQLAPSAGAIWVAGMRAKPELPARLFSTGIRLMTLLEQPGLAPGVSALENVALPLRYHASALSLHPDQATGLAREALAALAVYPPDLHSLPDRLSFGLQRRVALARILALRPRIVLLDDPLLGVDSESCQVIERVLRSWVRDPNLSLLCTSGDRDLGARLGARSADLTSDGVSQRAVTPTRAQNHPARQLVSAADPGDAGMLHWYSGFRTPPWRSPSTSKDP